MSISVLEWTYWCQRPIWP